MRAEVLRNRAAVCIMSLSDRRRKRREAIPAGGSQRRIKTQNGGNGMLHVMDRRAADNKYLHRDFHVTNDLGVTYIAEKYGPEGVDEYLRTFADGFYGPLTEKIKAEGLAAMEAHIKEIYEIEEASDALTITRTGEKGGKEELSIALTYCPAVRFMRAHGHVPSPYYRRLTETVDDEIAKNAGYGFEMLSYDEETGAASYRFFTKGE